DCSEFFQFLHAYFSDRGRIILTVSICNKPTLPHQIGPIPIDKQIQNDYHFVVIDRPSVTTNEKAT
ncbi:MAG: hypothetical protein ACK2UW_01955, partial [Anaerolineales bacterium]